MTNVRSILVSGAALALLAACEDEAVAPVAGEREPAGEVLEGTITDDMLPVEEVRSEAGPAVEDEDTLSGDTDESATPDEGAEDN